MADDKVALEIFIEADKANLSLGELEDGFEAMKEQLKNVGRGSEEFKQLSTAMAQTTGEIKNIELGFEGLDREQIASEFGGLAGGIGDVTASLVLMGGESETIEQIGASIEKAMAISMGFKGAIEGGAAAMKLYNNMIKTGKLQTILYSTATKVAAVATRVFNAVLKANPIALLVTAFVAAGAALLAFASSTKEASREQEILSEIQEDVISGMAKEQSEMESLVAIAKDETQTRHARNKAIQELNKLSPEYLGNLTLETINTKEATAAMNAYTESLVSQARAKALQAKLEEAVAIQLEAQTATGEEVLATMSSMEVANANLIGAKEAVLKKYKENTAAADEEVEAILNLIKAENKQVESHSVLAAAKAGLTVNVEELEKRAAEAEKARQKAWEAGAEARALARAKESQAKKDALMEDIERVEVDKTMQIEELDRHSIHIEGLISNEQALRDAMIQFSNAQLIKIEEERQARLAANQERLQSATQVIGAIGSINSAALATDLKNAGNNEKLKEKLRKASFEREKKLNIAMALVNGAQAQMSILAQTPKADFGIATAIAMAAAAVTTIAQIAAIKATSYQGGGSPAASESASAPSAGGAGAAGGGAAISPVSNTSTILGTQQVFVTETDITDTQNNVSVIEESATF
jgi:hypothetical protein